MANKELWLSSFYKMICTVCMDQSILTEGLGVIILCTKVESFKKKAAVVDLKCCFPYYKGGLDGEAALQFFRQKLEQTGYQKPLIEFTEKVDVECVLKIYKRLQDRVVLKNVKKI